MNALKNSRLPFVMVMFLTMTMVQNPSQAQEISPPLLVIAETLALSTGDAYIELRDQALALPGDEFEALITYLRADALQVEKRFLGSVLQIRSKESALTEQFEEKLAYMLARPHPTRHPDQVTYSSHVSSQPSNKDILHFEAVLKFDIPPAAKTSIFHRLSSGIRLHERNIEPFLAILESDVHPWFKSMTALSLGSTAARFPDFRVVPALVGAYREIRLARPVPEGRASLIPPGIGQVGSVEALEALQSLIEFEEELMPQHGLAAWDDADQFGIMDENRQVVRAHSQAQRQSRQANIEWTEEDEQGYQDQLAAVRQRLKARMLWERLLASRDELEAKLSGEEYDGREKYRQALEGYLKRQRDDQGDSDSIEQP